MSPNHILQLQYYMETTNKGEVQTTLKHLNLTRKPLLKVSLYLVQPF